MAPQAAGKIHSDFENGFIRAETISYKDFVELKGEAACRDFGKLRQEGKAIIGLELTKYIKNYASIGEKYVQIIESIIINNSLTDFDKANLLPTKLKTGIAL